MSKHPIQPLIFDEHNVLRFKVNAIVRHLLDHGGIDLNALARMDFSREDREHFAQLIGYSYTGFGDLSFVSDATYELAGAIFADPELKAKDLRIADLEKQLADLRGQLKAPIAALYGIHEDDLGEG
jgi:hypothetical protein